MAHRPEPAFIGTVSDSHDGGTFSKPVPFKYAGTHILLTSGVQLNVQSVPARYHKFDAPKPFSYLRKGSEKEYHYRRDADYAVGS
ncbi:hypothetical protein SDC9_181716 [bioreactor metagenome]|uniref:Uncharacterized protein n=1 Tax=bioreactor metagenome TaxID=1076179 RepID=A0A645HEU7_9ZZZZ